MVGENEVRKKSGIGIGSEIQIRRGRGDETGIRIDIGRESGTRLTDGGMSGINRTVIGNHHVETAHLHLEMTGALELRKENLHHPAPSPVSIQLHQPDHLDHKRKRTSSG